LFELRAAESDEASVLAALHLRTVLHAYADIFPPAALPPTLEDLTRDWERRINEAHVFVAVEAGALIGMVAAGTSEGAGHLSRLHVDPRRWGEGIGRALYDRCLADIELAGHDAATLWVLERNDRVRSWYELLGWQLTGERRPVYSPGGIDDVEYRLQLSRL